MKKIIALTVAALMLLLAVTGCSSGNAPGAGSKINVISREDGSGTRGAFIELFGIEEKDADGKKVDKTIDKAEITNSTSVMMTTIAGDPAAIGYISLGSLNDTVKAVSIDGVAPSAAAVKDGSYAISRPFNIATMGDLSPVAQDFIDFIMSADGQDVVESKGYIRVADTGAYNGNRPSGTVTVAGSSSVTPAMEALKEAYEKLNSNANIEIQQSDSTTGMNSVIEGICDIGMASRDIKDSESEKGIDATVIALDGIAVIVNNNSSVSNLTKEQVKSIYTGGITDWAGIQ
jgi:phosphate transport system substrate-binding protein